MINIKFFEEKITFDLFGQRPLKAALGGSTKLQRLGKQSLQNEYFNQNVYFSGKVV